MSVIPDRLTLLVALSIAATALAPPAAARPGHGPPEPRGWMSFHGDCEFAGEVRFTPPMTNDPQPIAQHATGVGTCDGTLVDRGGRTHELEAAPVSYDASSSGESVSCPFGLASGSGKLTFARGDLAFGFEETRVAATPLLEFTGAKSGSANGIATPSPDGDPLATITACGGDGLGLFLADLRFETSSPLVG